MDRVARHRSTALLHKNGHLVVPQRFRRQDSSANKKWWGEVVGEDCDGSGDNDADAARMSQRRRLTILV
jgi:hypothetical protein